MKLGKFLKKICYAKNSATVLAKKLAKISQRERLPETFTETTEEAFYEVIETINFLILSS